MANEGLNGQEKVCVLWNLSPDGDTVNTLAYGDGSIRVYARDRLDSRVGSVRYVDTLPEAIQALRGADGIKIAVPIGVARRIGTSAWKFADDEEAIV